MTPPADDDKDLFAKIHDMLPAARRVLAGGMDIERVEFDDDAALEVPLPADLTDEQRVELLKWTEANYLLGIAVGLLLNPALVLAEAKGGSE